MNLTPRWWFEEYPEQWFIILLFYPLNIVDIILVIYWLVKRKTKHNMAALWVFVALGYILLYAFASVSPLMDYNADMTLSPIQMQSWNLPQQADVNLIRRSDNKLPIGGSHLWWKDMRIIRREIWKHETRILSPMILPIILRSRQCLWRRGRASQKHGYIEKGNPSHDRGRHWWVDK